MQQRGDTNGYTSCFKTHVIPFGASISTWQNEIKHLFISAIFFFLYNKFSSMGIVLVVMSALSLAAAITSRGEHTTLIISIVMSIIAGLCAHSCLPKLGDTFIKANLSGRDLLKRDKPLL